MRKSKRLNVPRDDVVPAAAGPTSDGTERSVGSWDGGLATPGEHKIPPKPRPAPAGAVIGVDFGRRHILVAVADPAFKVRALMSRTAAVAEDGRTALDTAAYMATRLLKRTGLAHSDVSGVGIALPGPRENGLASTSILPGWKDLQPLEDEMRQRLGWPATVGNDADLGALGEWVCGAGQGYSHVLYVLATTGVGCGLIINGQLYGGASGSAGELGHMVVDKDGPYCETCSNHGCIDTVLSGWAITQKLRSTSNLPETLNPEESLRLAIQWARGGDRGCIKALTEVSERLGGVVANLCTLLNPELVVLGGPLSQSEPIAVPAIRKAIQWATLRPSAAVTRVVAGKLHNKASVFGALALVLSKANHYVSSQPDYLGGLSQRANGSTEDNIGPVSQTDRTSRPLATR